MKPSRILAPGLACLLFLTLLSVAWAEAVGVSWRNFGTRDTASIDWCTPNSITYWGGYKIGSQWGADGRYIYASTDQIVFDQSKADQLRYYWQSSGYQYVPTTVSFDEQAKSGGLHTGLDATGWYYINLPSPEISVQDDNGDGRNEEFKIRWWPDFSPGRYDIEVEFRDPDWSPWTATGGEGKINVSSYITTAVGWVHIDHDWLWAFCYPTVNDLGLFGLC